MAVAVSASAKEGETRTCETKLGGQVVSLKNFAAAAVCAAILAAAASASAKADETPTCKPTFGGQVVCGNLTIGITLEQYEARPKVRAEEIRGEEAEKRVQLQKLMELTERATSAEKENLCTPRSPS